MGSFWSGRSLRPGWILRRAVRRVDRTGRYPLCGFVPAQLDIQVWLSGCDSELAGKREWLSSIILLIAPDQLAQTESFRSGEENYTLCWKACSRHWSK